MATEAHDRAAATYGAQQTGESPAATPSPRRLTALAARYAHSFSFVGLAFALVFFCLSLTPSLIPRTWLYQAVISGLSAISGYGIGVLVAWGVRTMGFRPTYAPARVRLGWRVLAGATVVLVPVFIILGAHWQDAIRHLFSAEPGGKWRGFLQALVAVTLAIAVLQVARGLRWVTRLAARLLDRFVPIQLARVVAVVLVAVLTVLLVNGTIVRFVMDRFNAAYALVDTTTPEGAVQPTIPQRSGSPDSLSAWDTLGAQGRKFVSSGPSLEELTAFVDSGDVPGVQEAMEPIRAYAGMATGDDLDDVAALVVAELDRTDAWSRELLVVATSTGTGWIDPSAIQTIEFLHGGNTAIASMQYSYLPSWVSFVGDRSTPPLAGKALFEAVYEAWSDKPEDARPQLVVFGLSLGSYGSQGAFSGLQDIQQRTQGAVWAGTPSFTDTWADLTAARDQGSWQYAPVLDDGRTVRWGAATQTAADLWAPTGTWEHPRVAYLQHASDAVVWWSPDLIFEEPDWLREPRGPGVLTQMHWIPVVTFWQVTMDMFVAGEVPSGFGHNYQLEYAEAWAAVAPPDGWTDEDTTRLRAEIATQPNES